MSGGLQYTHTSSSMLVGFTSEGSVRGPMLGFPSFQYIVLIVTFPCPLKAYKPFRVVSSVL